MQTTMEILHLFIFIALLLPAPSAAQFSAPSPSPLPEAPAGGSGSDFIRSSCETTRYPELCYHSLFSYANAVQQDSGRLARAAVAVSLSRAATLAATLAAYLANLTRRSDYGDDHRAAAAVRDCSSLFGDAVDQIRGSLSQMRRLGGGGGAEELRFQLSNVQTWMSAALTNEDTCTDGFDGVTDGQMKTDVCDRTDRVKEVTSNALALVNTYADKIVNP